MARRKQPIDLSETIFRPTPRLERWRRIVRYLENHRVVLVARGVDTKELATFDSDLDDLRSIVRGVEIYPPDTPEPEPEPERVEQPLVTPGSETAITEIFRIALGDDA